MLKSGTSAKLIQTSLPPEPVPPFAVVDAPFLPTPCAQCPAVTTMVLVSNVPEQVNQAPGSVNRGSTSSCTENTSSPTYGWAPLSGTPLAMAQVVVLGHSRAPVAVGARVGTGRRRCR